MLAFVDKIILPLLSISHSRKIVEVGAEFGNTTLKLLEYCRVVGGHLFVADPAPRFDVEDYKRRYHKQFHMLKDYSLEILPHIHDYDCILLDGDHNWYTVYNELKCIEKMALRNQKLPIILLHDTEWPYGRRDMYYFPDSIPDLFRKPYAKKGMKFGQSILLESGGANAILNNALYENGPWNGVLTAIEDFLKQTPLPYSFHRCYSNNGLGILTPKHPEFDKNVQNLITASGL
ncbi:class I SAM-dependent methyltransferase [Paenibacillus aquistagni]|uniref:class I SAM-dependent methyltransferase n=1 Tax=Paenibacillus aquistagni TaxID=1852522 RepID=UPI000B4FD931|nr:class I SAM-dependent methyltransferase [Paenibacillus aquistagni]